MEQIVRFLRPSSVRSEIDFQIEQFHMTGIQPTLVRMSSKASARFAIENHAREGRVSNAQKLYDGHNCLCHIIYRDPTVRWVKVEGMPKKEFNQMLREGRSPLEELYGV